MSWRGLHRALRGALVVAVAAFAVTVVLRWGETAPLPPVGAVIYACVYVLASALLVLQRAAEPHERWAWRALGAGTALYGLGSAYHALVLRDLDAIPYPSVADVLHLARSALAYLAVLLLLRAQVHRFYLSTALDGVVAGLGFSAVVVGFVLGGLERATTAPTAELATNLAHLVGDLLILVVAVAGAAVLGLRASRSFVLVVLGLTSITVADVVHLHLSASDSFVAGSGLDLLWLLGALLLALAPGRTPAAGSAGGADGDRARVDKHLLVLPTASAVASLVVLGLQQVLYVRPLAGLLAVGCLLAALVRASLTFAEVRRHEQRELADAHRQARTDDLTGLPNRRALYEACDRIVPSATREAPVSLLLLDLDRFKEINDSLGHAAGDDLLVQVARRLSGSCGAQGVVARLGGDEFAAVLPATGTAAAVALARGLRAALAAPLTVLGTSLHVDASIGVVTATSPVDARGELLRRADIAMYRAKRDRSGLAVATEDDPAASPDRLRATEELRAVLAGGAGAAHGRLLVHLQPQIRLDRDRDRGDVVGFEALARWEHPGRGLVLPPGFVPLAEAADLTGRLADTVLDLALGACGRWWAAGHRVPVSVNLSTSDLRERSLPDRITAALRRHTLPGAALVVEITEQMVLVDPPGAQALLARIRSSGVAVSIDDYGTGYSSLAYLRELPVDELKLDRAFTMDVVADLVSASIVRTTVDLAHSLGLRLVAEGVETAAAQELLASFGCDVGQGHHIAPPMPSPQALAWLEGRALTAPVVSGAPG